MRVDHLRSLGILDTPPERAFDDLARLASYICGTPIALIGFMDADRLWFKSRIGWDVPEIPREMSFCAHTILQSDTLIVSDALEDHDRLATCPLATHGGMRFYAGVSLMSSEGYALGTLCAMDSVPRGLTPGQIEALRKLAHQVVTLVESRRPTSEPALSVRSIQQDDESVDDAWKVQGFSFWRNVAEQKRTCEALRHNEERLLSIIGSAMDAIITIDSNQCIVMFNKAAEAIFSCPASAALGQPIDKFIPDRLREIHRQRIREFAHTGVTTRSMELPGTLVALRANGEEFPIEATISQVSTQGEQLFTVILRDISARLRMETELRQAQKMEALGQLAGGIAHEFNNFLGVILGYSELLSEEADANEKLRRYLSEISAATLHTASLTHQLLAFGHKQVVEPRVLDLNRCIRESHSLLRRLVPANVDVVPVLAPTMGRIKADPGQVQQVLLNLVINACDAMPQGGKVVIETTDTELDEAYASRYGGLQPGSYVLLSISDTGLGMSVETLAHLFEPFYTTKEPGKGTGLGLSTVYGIAKHSGGHVSVESSEGKGTTVRVYLPRVYEAVEESQVPKLHPIVQTLPVTVLVVEDENALRELICISLEKRHHKVLVAKDGDEALEIFRQHIAEIQLVITDLIMPHMDGFELKHRIAALRPDVRFLFMSGYAEQIARQHNESLESSSFLEKPFLLAELANKVRGLLAGEAAA